MQVADCYIRVRYRPLAKDEFEELPRRLFAVVTDVAQSVKRAEDLDFTFEEGSLLQHVMMVGVVLSAISQYHDLRASVADMLHDAETFSADQIYTRRTPRDLNRMRRIVSAFDEVAKPHLPKSELQLIRNRVILDLAGLARARPDDPEMEKLVKLLPKHQIPDLPSTPREAIRMDRERREMEEHFEGWWSYSRTSEHGKREEYLKEYLKLELPPTERVSPLPRPPRRCFHRRVTINRKPPH